MLASRAGCVELVKWLVEKGADLNRRDSEGWTALMFSVDRGMGRVSRLLLDNGADPSVISRDGQCAADIAACNGKTILQDIIESFYEDGGNGVDKHSSKIRIVPEMENILTGLGLRKLVPLFKDHKVGLHEFLMMREEDFEEMGVEEAEVQKLMTAQVDICRPNSLKRKNVFESAEMKRQGLMLSVPSASAMLADISKHTKYTKANIGKYFTITYSSGSEI